MVIMYILFTVPLNNLWSAVRTPIRLYTPVAICHSHVVRRMRVYYILRTDGVKKYRGTDERERGRVRRTVVRHHRGGGARAPVPVRLVLYGTSRVFRRRFPGRGSGVWRVGRGQHRWMRENRWTSGRCCWPVAGCCRRDVRLSVGDLQDRGSSDGRRRRTFGGIVRTERKRTWSAAAVAGAL